MSNTQTITLSDTELIARVTVKSSGQSIPGGLSPEKAFRQLVNRYLPIVYHFILRLVREPELAEDIAQDVFVKVYQNLHRFDTAKPFKPWLFKIASNTAATEMKKLQKRKTMELMEDEQAGQMPGRLIDQLPDTGAADVEAGLELSDTARMLSEHLGRLDAKFREALLLRYQQSLSYEDISETMQIPVNTVRTWLRRGKEKLLKELQADRSADLGRRKTS